MEQVNTQTRIALKKAFFLHPLISSSSQRSLLFPPVPPVGDDLYPSVCVIRTYCGSCSPKPSGRKIVYFSLHSVFWKSSPIVQKSCSISLYTCSITAGEHSCFYQPFAVVNNIVAYSCTNTACVLFQEIVLQSRAWVS